MSYTKNYYHILGLSSLGLSAPSSGSARARPKSAELRRAYRNALLAAHPDKKTTTTATASDQVVQGYSVDDVREAYRVLDERASRAEYDNWVLRNPHVLQGTAENKAGEGQTLSADFILGLDVLDLSDFEERESGEEVEWTRACRCGDQMGFRILEVDLVDAEQRGEKEVLVGCGGCSLWVRVGFDVEEG